MERKQFLKSMASMPLLAAGMGPLLSTAVDLNALNSLSRGFAKSERTPLIFIGHGHPMNALLDNSFTQTLAKIGSNIERPSAIMVISAHWATHGTFVSINPQPKAIYDFGRIDDRLFHVQYAPPGHPDLAKQLIAVAPHHAIQADLGMGLDHGAWTVLKHMFPIADVPVFQMSIDMSQPPAYHFQLASALKKMREKGVLIIASGNIVHNLRVLDWQNIDAKPFDWAVEFDELVKAKLSSQDFQALVHYERFGSISQMAHPTNDHYLPMLYTLGLADKHESVTYLYEGIQYGSASMRCFQIS